ncbi:MAG: universal stress protein [Rubrivivax sp.]|nr:universal stress protein [Rubrivivax sp.]
MYQHILVPIDDTPLASVTIARAVAYARSSGARITFFHAAPDLAATGEGAMLYNLDRSAFGQARSEQGQGGLLRARTAADIAGVVCETLARTTDHPAQAIHDSAHAQGCDLVFLCSHGRAPGWRGWLRGSVTQRLLEITDLPVLVAGIEANDAEADMHKALGVISAEHRSIGAVLRGMQQLVRDARADQGRLNTALMRQMIDYLRSFPAVLHHPKEEAHLFRLLRQRDDSSGVLLQELERQHTLEAALVDAVAGALAGHTPADAASLDTLGDAVQRLAGAVWEHMSLEEAQVLPAARRHLQPEDWKAVADAFTAHVDPLREVDVGQPLTAAFAHIAASLLTPPAART